MIGALELGSAWMLGWLAAAAIPLALHLLHRRRQQELPWAAIDLLMQAIQQNSRTLRIEGWLLLLLRTLALILFALAIARPFLRGNPAAEAALAQPPRLWIIVIDTSYSMQASPGRSSLFQQAQQAAMELVSRSQPGDAFTLVELAEPSRALIGQPSFDADQVTAEIKRLRCSDSGGDLGSCLAVIQHALEDARSAITRSTEVEIVFFSDMGRDTWRSVQAKGALQELSARFRVSIEKLAVVTPGNVAVTAFEAESSLALEGRLLRCSATVQNYREAPLVRLPLQFQSAGATVHTEFVDCAPGQSRTVSAELLAPPGRHWNISAAIPADELLVDNRRELVVSVRPRVWIVTVEETNGAGRLVNLALAPTGLEELDRGSKTRPAMAVESWNMLELQTLPITELDAIVLTDISELSTATVKKLEQFVNSGGAVLALVGPRTVRSAWNQSQDSFSQLMGFQLVQPAARDDLRIDPLEYASPIARPFANYLDAGLLTTPIFRYWQIDPRAAGSQSTGLVVDLALNTGDPWLVHRPVGEGTVGAMLSAPQSGAATGDGDAGAWNAIATWPSFVPILQGTIHTMIGASEGRYNVTVGQPLRGTLPPTAQAIDLVVHRPDNASSRLTVPASSDQGRISWVYANTDRAGVYDVVLPESARDQSRDAPSQLYAVNIDPSQSDLQSINDSELLLAAGASESLVPPGGSAASQIPGAPSERLSRTLLLVLMGVLAVESVLAWHLGRQLTVQSQSW